MWAVGNKKNNLGKTETDVGTARPRLWNDVCGNPRAIAFAGLLKTALNPDTKTRPTVTSYVCSAVCATSLVKGSWPATVARMTASETGPRDGPCLAAAWRGWALDLRPGSWAGPLSVLRDDQVDVRGDVPVKPERNLVLTKLLQRVLELDLAAVDLDLVLQT